MTKARLAARDDLGVGRRGTMAAARGAWVRLDGAAPRWALLEHPRHGVLLEEAEPLL